MSDNTGDPSYDPSQDAGYDDDAFDQALCAAVFDMAAARGWRRANVGEAARTAGLDLRRARTRAPSLGVLLLRFGALADRAAMGVPADDLDPRERLFDMVMRRFDMLQRHRPGVLALLAAVPTDPGLSLMLYGTNLRSMNWLLGAAGVPAGGLSGGLRTHGLLAVWLTTLRAWRKDDSTELSATMAALDKALTRAVDAERWLPGGGQRADAEVFADEAAPEIVPEPVADGSVTG